MDRRWKKDWSSACTPEWFFAGPGREKQVRELATSYSYKDVLAYQDIRNSGTPGKTFAGSLASGRQRGIGIPNWPSLLGVNKVTVENYIRILEQAYIIFRVGPFSRNIRNELKKSVKFIFMILVYGTP